MKVLLRVTAYAWPYRSVWAATYVAMLTTLSLGVLPPYLLGTAVDEVLAGSKRGDLLLLGGVFEDRASAVREHTYAANRLWASHGSFMTLILSGAVIATLLLGGREMEADRLSPGELASSILLVGLLVWQVGRIGWWVNSAALAVSSGKRVFEVLDAESLVRTRPDAKTIGRARGHVAFHGVSLAYDEGPPAVSDIDFGVDQGQVVALLGAPGSGKSTIVHMIPRFYEPSAGRVTVDGVDVRDVTLHSLRANVGIVLQDVFVFGASLRDNIAYGTDVASERDVIRVSRIAQLHDFAESLPEGYDTLVGERGVTLSGGQQQRLAIARTLLLDPPILVLDDSTSSVDVGTESRIQEALARVIEGRTTFVIAHRLSTIRKADLIVFMDDGNIVEIGTHRELLAREGHYRQIHDLQLVPQEVDALFRDPASVAEGGV